MPNMNYEVHATIVPTPTPEQVEALESELFSPMFEAMSSLLIPELSNGEQDLYGFDGQGQGSVKIEITEEGEESSARASLVDWGYGPSLYYKDDKEDYDADGDTGMIEKTLERDIEVPGGWTLSGVEVVIYPYEIIHIDSQNPG